MQKLNNNKLNYRMTNFTSWQSQWK